MRKVHTHFVVSSLGKAHKVWKVCQVRDASRRVCVVTQLKLLGPEMPYHFAEKVLRRSVKAYFLPKAWCVGQPQHVFDHLKSLKHLNQKCPLCFEACWQKLYLQVWGARLKIHSCVGSFLILIHISSNPSLHGESVAY